jgi:S-DNA-T family DNA segregation ATPase FtsK/SpoIIIE
MSSNRTISARKGSQRKFEDGLPLVTKKQILGFMLVLFGILIIMSIVSYSTRDHSVYESINLINLIDLFTSQIKSSQVYVSNWLGISGVMISGFLVTATFGYFSLGFPVVIIIFGIQLLRKRKLSELMSLYAYIIASVIILSTFTAALRKSIGEGKIPYEYFGTSGEYFASILTVMLGNAGTFILLFVSIITIIFLSIDRDIVKSFARMKLWIDRIKERFRASRDEMLKHTEIKKSRRAVRQSGSELGTDLIKSREHKEDLVEPEIKEALINRPEYIDLTAQPSANKEREISFSPAVKTDNEIFETDSEQMEESAGNLPHDETEDQDYVNNEILADYKMPSPDLLDEPLKEELEVVSDDELNENSRLLQAKLLNFGVRIQKVIATPGPVVTLYEIVPEEDIKLSRIESLQDDIALALKAKGIRMIIPMPGKGTVGVEIPNHKSVTVKIRGVLASRKFNEANMHLPIALGKTISGEVLVDDLARMPHLLVAGSTGSGKSVGINTIITSLLYKLRPEDLKFVLIDPKKIELNLYDKLRNHYLAFSRDYSEKIITMPQNAVMALKSIEIEMDKRYDRLANATVRHISDYNRKFAEGKLKDDENIKHGKMPYIVVIIDELADLMITASREIEEPIARIAQLARAVGIHLILATQRPSVDVITGVIKANFPARIAYLVNSKVDSRTILDMNGAEQLLGQGDMLYLPPGINKPIRVQSPFISSEEVERITDFIGAQKGFTRPYLLPSVNQKKRGFGSSTGERDELFEEAAKIIVRYQRGSVSLLQRKLKIGYSRAARIVDELEEANIVGPNVGSKEREVLVESEEQLKQLL